MRPIKFRVWHKRLKIIAQLKGINIDNKEILVSYEKNNRSLWILENCELMQFTGLQDKNGDDIYEGDILKQIPYHMEKSELIFVKFTKFDKCGGCPHQTWGMGFDVGEYGIDHLEIIGNIHEIVNIWVINDFK